MNVSLPASQTACEVLYRVECCPAIQQSVNTRIYLLLSEIADKFSSSMELLYLESDGPECEFVGACRLCKEGIPPDFFRKIISEMLSEIAQRFSCNITLDEPEDGECILRYDTPKPHDIQGPIGEDGEGLGWVP